jgi:hypothetical protein
MERMEMRITSWVARKLTIYMAVNLPMKNICELFIKSTLPGVGNVLLASLDDIMETRRKWSTF